MRRSRDTSGRKVGEIKHKPTGTTVALYLNAGMEFSASYEDTIVSNRDGTIVRKAILEAIESKVAIAWVPVIAIHTLEWGEYTYNSDRLDIAQLGLALRRFYLAQAKDNTLRVCSWDTPEDGRLIASESYGWREKSLVLPFQEAHDTIVVAYTEELWAGLNAIHAAVKELRNRLVGIISDEAGRKVIADAGAKAMKLLMAPTSTATAPTNHS